MTDSEHFYNEVASDLADAEKSQFFGKPCYKINKKAFVSFFKESMVFKLEGNSHSEALSLDGSELFDPSGKNRPMKQWVQVPYNYKDKWSDFAQGAIDYVGSLKK